MKYGYMRIYEDRVRRAVNTPDRNGNFALWQGGMQPNIPVGSQKGIALGMKRALAGGENEQQAGASGKWVAHWKMVHIVRPIWEKAGAANQLGRAFPPLTYGQPDADNLVLLEPAPRTVRGPAICSRWRCSTATPSAAASRRRRSSRPTTSATTTSFT